jgi:1-acyl-sn-glycerol-3-phosphate acyltransferase
MEFTSRGTLMHEPGAVVANHVSWLDIFVLNARKRVYFVAKSEVAAWPGIGWLARATGTVFIRRARAEAAAQRALFEARLAAGHRLLFFPEGTSTDGRRVLGFRTTLFAAFEAPAFARLAVQPVTLRYAGPPGDPAFYGWWGDRGFGEHLLAVLAAPRQGSVEILYHPPLTAGEHADRKALARAAEAAVRRGLEGAATAAPAPVSAAAP